MGAYSDDLLFVHIPKCAGTSVREWLKAYVPGTTDFRDDDCDLPIGHIPLKDIERYTGRKLDSFDKIVAVIRNPYTHQLSQWLFWRHRRATGGLHVHDVVAGMHPTLTSWLHDTRCDFHIWYETQQGSSGEDSGYGWNLKRTASPINRYPAHGGYFRYWLEVDGAFPHNLCLMRMEELHKVWLSEVGQYAVDGAPALPVSNAGSNSVMDVEKAKEWYTTNGLDIVNDKFRWTFANKFYPMLVPTTAVKPSVGPVL